MSVMNLVHVDAPRCVECGLSDQVPDRIVCTSQGITGMPVEQFWDGHGTLHHHDPNITTMEYACDRGHHWSVQRLQPPCIACSNPQDNALVPLSMDRRFCVLDAETGAIIGMVALVTGEGRMMVPLTPVPSGAVCLAIDP